MADLSTLIRLVENGENEKAVTEADRLFSDGVSAKEIIVDGLTVALQALKDKCTIENFQLLEVLLSSRALVEVVDQVIARELENSMDQIVSSHNTLSPKEPNSKVLVVGTIQGDVHDLGKHLVATLSSLSGLKVINLGKDVSPQTFVNAAVKENADFIGVSALMTVCLPLINDIRPLAVENNIKPIIVAGGAAAQQADRDYLDVDYVAFDVFDGLNYFLK